MMKMLMPLLLWCCLTSLQGQNVNDKTLSPYFEVIGSAEEGGLPLQRTAVETQIAGVVAEVKVSQEYYNAGTTPLEAIYIFPASTRAAVHAMEMHIGKRIVKAEIRERNQARAEYETAKAEGRRASLLEQQRPNVFQMNVANIMPGERVIVVLEYTELLVPENGIYSWVYPMVVGPRYSEKNNTTASTHDQFVDSPYTPADVVAQSRLDVNVVLHAGMPIQTIESPTHEVLITQKRKRATIRLAESEHYGGNRDLIINYQLRGGAIQTGLLTYEHEDESFFLLMVQPPARPQASQIPAREFVFVVDVSGSMNGFPIDVSKSLLRKLVGQLQPYDRFNILFFAGASNWLAEESLTASSENLEKAIHMLDGVRSGGGTRLLPALQKSLDLPTCEAGLSRSIVVITDGYIDVEREAFDLIRRNLSAANLFAFGIGSSVNRHLIEGMAHVGMGEPFVALNKEDATTVAERFRTYIETPLLADVSVTYEGLEVYDLLPQQIPNLLAERPLIVMGKYKGEVQGNITISGVNGDGRYSETIAVSASVPRQQNGALRQLWAREQIRLLDDYQKLSHYQPDQLKVTQLGLQYNLMTAYTSFVAIERDRIANTSGDVEQVKQVQPLPQGVSNSAVGFDLEVEGVVRRNQSRQWRIEGIASTTYTSTTLEHLKNQIPKWRAQLPTTLAKEWPEHAYCEWQLLPNGQWRLYVNGQLATEALHAWWRQRLTNDRLNLPAGVISFTISVAQ